MSVENKIVSLFRTIMIKATLILYSSLVGLFWDLLLNPLTLNAHTYNVFEEERQNALEYDGSPTEWWFIPLSIVLLIIWAWGVNYISKRKGENWGTLAYFAFIPVLLIIIIFIVWIIN